MSGRRGGRGGHGGGRMSREVQVSKKISWLLRHGAEKEGLKLGPGGYVNVKDALNTRCLRSLQVTFAELREVVSDNDKQRFSLIPITSAPPGTAGPSSEGIPTPMDDDATASADILDDTDPSKFLVRANQGHSIKIDADGLLEPITSDSELPPVVVHGTTHSAWLMILKTGGLKPMTRNHIHFAAGLPKGFKSLEDTEGDGQLGVEAQGKQKETEKEPVVISGMRNSSTILIYIDLPKALNAGLKFWRSENGVILSEGAHDGPTKGIVALEFFKRVEERKRGLVLVKDGAVVQDLPADLGGGKNKAFAKAKNKSGSGVTPQSTSSATGNVTNES